MKLQHLLLLIAFVLVAACGRNPEPTPGSDFAVLARAAEGYAEAESGGQLGFPRDHGPHGDYRIEWWYLTVNLQDAQGRHYGAQWTLFRTAVQPPDRGTAANAWQSNQLFMAHFALTWPDGHQAWQRYARGGDHGGESRAGVTAEPFAAWMDDWILSSTGREWLPLTVTARQDRYALALNLDAAGPLVLQGQEGFSQKHPEGGGSWYYSQPFLKASGVIELEGETLEVEGQAWLDREWSSQFLQADQAGWDWFALHLDSGEKLMLFRLRPVAGTQTGAWQHGALISPDGSTMRLDSSGIGLRVLQTERISGRLLPLHWRVDLPQIQRSFEIRALHPDQWMDLDFPYWEGAVTVSGTGQENRGRGYMELTGYPLN